VKTEFYDDWTRVYPHGFRVRRTVTERERVGEVFISHVSDDEERIRDVVTKRFSDRGIPCFLPDTDIEPGENWLDRLEQAMGRASCGVVVLTENSLPSQWVWYETGMFQGPNKPAYYTCSIISTSVLSRSSSHKSRSQKLSPNSSRR
jgi:hypothetical protein